MGASASGEDFGLDDYEPRFFYPFADWVDQGTFSVFAPSVSNTANIDPNDNDFFYFCHIHAGMSGRVKILDSKKNVLSPPDVPEIPAEYYQIQSEFDAGCGTYGISAFELPNPNCPVNFVCGAVSELENFAACFNAPDCAMTSGMSNEVGSQDDDVSDEIALFINQMIPHHQNAVNMCKTLIKQHLKCANSHQKAQKKILVVPCPCFVPRSSMSRITRFRLCKVFTISKAKAAVVKAQKKAVVKVPKKAKLLKAENLIRVRKTTKPPRVV